MKCFKYVGLFLSLVLGHMGIQAQLPFKAITSGPIELAFARSTEANLFKEKNQVFKVDGNRYLYVRSQYADLVKVSNQIVSTYLFDATGALLSSNSNVMAQGDITSGRIISVVQHAGRVLVVTRGDESSANKCIFWDITNDGAPKKVKELDIWMKGDKAPTIVTSPDQKYMAILSSNNARHLSVVDREFDTVYSIDLVPNGLEKGQKPNHVEAFAIDNEGYVAISMFFEEPTGFLATKTSGSWLFIGLDIFQGNVHAWNMAEELQLGQFYLGRSAIATMNYGKVAYAYPHQAMYTAILDLKSGELVTARRMDVDELHGAPQNKKDIRPLFLKGLHITASGDILIALHTWANNGDDIVLTYDQDLKQKSLAHINWEDFSPDLDIWGMTTIGNDLLIPSYSTTQKLNALGSTNIKDIKLLKKDLQPNVVFYDGSANKYEYVLLTPNPKISQANRQLILSNTGFIACIEYQGKVANISIVDLAGQR